MYFILLVIMYLAFISLGLPDSLLGSAWPVIYQDLNISISLMGPLTIVISSGTIIASLFTSKVNQKLGPGLTVTISVLLTAIAMFGFSQSNQYYMLILSGLPYGLGAGAIDSTLNNYVSLNYKPKHMNFLHAFWGVGTLIGPIVMSQVIGNGSGWQSGYFIISMIQIFIALILLMSLKLWKRPHQNSMLGDKQEHLNFFEVLKIKHVKYILFGFLLYTGFEAVMFNWASSYLINTRSITEDLAAFLASLIFMGMTVGRLITGFLSIKIKGKGLIRIGYVFIVIGILLLLIPGGNLVVAIIGILMCGLGAAPIFPQIIHTTPLNFGTKNSQSIIAIEMAFAYTGVVMMPPIFALLTNYIPIAYLPIYLLILILSSFILFEQFNKKSRLES